MTTRSANLAWFAQRCASQSLKPDAFLAEQFGHRCRAVLHGLDADRDAVMIQSLRSREFNTLMRNHGWAHANP